MLSNSNGLVRQQPIRVRTEGSMTWFGKGNGLPRARIQTSAQSFVGRFRIHAELFD